MKTIFWLNVLLIFYIYLGYITALRVFVPLFHKSRDTTGGDKGFLPTVSVIIAAHNEEKVIAQRIKNLLEQDYQKDRLEIIVASDGSIDETVKIARAYEDLGIKVLDFKQNRGRSFIQNDGVKASFGEVVVFTDAETEFEKDFLQNIVKYFSDNSVGCVVGNLLYKITWTSISESEGLYWRHEKQLRKLESDIGILATATGACMAVRKNLWKDLTPIDDCDFNTPLDVILQGYGVAYAPDAIAYDAPPSSIKGEMKTRIRQTSKNLVGTLNRWGWRGWFKHPLVSWGLLSHKILRWFTPFFLLEILISNLLLLREGAFYHLTFVSQLAFYLLAIVGLLGEKFNKRIPIASLIFSFCVANLGMAIGVVKGLVGRAPASYSQTD